MYYLIVSFLMVILPIGSIAIEIAISNPINIILVILKWFVFWAIGIRFVTAGIRQIIQPKYTSENILGIKDSQSLILVRELGFSNTAIGVIGILALLINQWIIPAALSGGMFLGLAGINHILQRDKNDQEKVAMISDLFIFVIILIFIILSLMK